MTVLFIFLFFQKGSVVSGDSTETVKKHKKKKDSEASQLDESTAGDVEVSYLWCKVYIYINLVKQTPSKEKKKKKKKSKDREEETE